MSLARLSSGEYVAIDCAILSAVGKAELDLLTDNGRLLVAVLNTHPYHSVGNILPAPAGWAASAGLTGLGLWSSSIGLFCLCLS